MTRKTYVCSRLILATDGLEIRWNVTQLNGDDLPLRKDIFEQGSGYWPLGCPGREEIVDFCPLDSNKLEVLLPEAFGPFPLQNLGHSVHDGILVVHRGEHEDVVGPDRRPVVGLTGHNFVLKFRPKNLAGKRRLHNSITNNKPKLKDFFCHNTGNTAKSRM